MRFREEILNYTLAQILRDYTFSAHSEVIVSKKLPDVLITIGGLKVILEGKREGDWKELDAQAQRRLESGMSDVSLALQYPDHLYEAQDEDDLKKAMASAVYDGGVYYWGQKGLETLSFGSRNVQELVEMLDRVVKLYIKNELLTSKIQEINDAIGKLTGEGKQVSLYFQGSVVERRLREALGVGEELGEEKED